MKFSVIYKFVATSLLVTSTISIAFASPHHAYKNYKDDYKGEAPCPTPPSLHDGFYVGAQAGYDAYRYRQSLTGDGSISLIGSVTGWVGGLFVGYGQYFNNYFYLGGELLGNYNGSNQVTMAFNSDGDTLQQKLQPRGTWGLTLIPGLKLNDASLGYFRLGYDWTNFHSSVSGTDLGGPSFSGSKSSTQGGWDFGLGIETLVYENWSVRTEYNHVWYNSFTNNAAGTSVTFKPSDNQFTLGAVYHIA